MEKIKVNAQSSIKISASKVLYFDPFRITEETHDADAIFITHEHYDHFSPEDIAKVANEKTVLIAPFSMLEKTKVVNGRPITKFVYPKADSGYRTFYIDGGVEFCCVCAYNTDKPFHKKENGWLGYLVTMDGLTYYITGDTDENTDNSNVSCDVMFVPCGGKYTFNAKEAAEYTAKIKPALVVPTHYGDVVGTSRDGKKFAEALAKLDGEIMVQIQL